VEPEPTADVHAARDLGGRALHDVIRRESGVIVRDGATTLVLSPPLVMSTAEADEVVAAIRSVLERTGVDGRIAPR
jgi:adenosylmethionine-8-amino-7-oxononanoate aminotransferase